MAENLIEGDLIPGSKVVVIEDLISTGSSSIAAIQNLLNAVPKNSSAEPIEVLGLVAIFDYKLDKSVKNFSNLALPYYSLSNYDDLVDVALDHGHIKEADVEFLKQWRQSL